MELSYSLIEAELTKVVQDALSPFEQGDAQLLAAGKNQRLTMQLGPGTSPEDRDFHYHNKGYLRYQSTEEPATAMAKLQRALDEQRRGLTDGWGRALEGLWVGLLVKKNKKSKKGEQKSVAVWASLTHEAILACTRHNDRLNEESMEAPDGRMEIEHAQRSFEEEWSNKEGLHALGMVLGNQYLCSKIERKLQAWAEGLEGKRALPPGSRETPGAFWTQEQTIIKALSAKVFH